MGGTPNAEAATRFLILSDEGEVEDCQRVVAERYFVASLYKAKTNGIRRSIDGKPVLCWPSSSVQAMEAMREFALELTDWCPEVKFLDASLPLADLMRPKDFPDFKALLLWATGELDGTNKIQVIPRPDAVVQVNRDSPEGGPPPLNPVSQDMDADQAAPGESRPIEDWQADPDENLTAAYGSSERPESDDQPPSTDISYRPADRVQTGNTWPEPVDLWNVVLPPEMKAEWLPEALGGYALHEAETMGADPGMQGLYMVGLCAGFISDSIQLQVKPNNPRYLESARIWALVCGRPGCMKSPALKEIMGPAWSRERELRKTGIKTIEKHENLIKVWEKKRDHWITETAKGKELPELDDKPSLPPKNRVIVGNATTEALMDVCEANPRGVIGVIDEIVSVWTGQGQYKKNGGSDRQDMLQGWNGGPYVLDRKGRDALIENWGFSLIGGTQTTTIKKIAAQLALDSDGMMQRFNVYTARASGRDIDRDSDHAGHARFSLVLERLYDMELGNEGPVLFSNAAQAIRRKFSDWVHDLKQDRSISEPLRSHFDKFNAQFARLCLTYHAIASSLQDNAYKVIWHEIPVNIAKQVAALIQDCLYPHAVQYYAMLSDDTNGRDEARKFAEFVLARDMREIKPGYLPGKWTHYEQKYGGPNCTNRERQQYWDGLQTLGWVYPLTSDRKNGIATLYGIPESAYDGRFAQHQATAKADLQYYRSKVHAKFIEQQQPREVGSDDE